MHMSVCVRVFVCVCVHARAHAHTDRGEENLHSVLVTYSLIECKSV